MRASPPHDDHREGGTVTDLAAVPDTVTARIVAALELRHGDGGGLAELARAVRIAAGRSWEG